MLNIFSLWCTNKLKFVLHVEYTQQVKLGIFLAELWIMPLQQHQNFFLHVQVFQEEFVTAIVWLIIYLKSAGKFFTPIDTSV